MSKATKKTDTTTNNTPAEQAAFVMPSLLREFFSDKMLHSAVKRRVEAEQTDLIRIREGADKRKVAAEKEIEAIDLKLKQLQGILDSIGNDPVDMSLPNTVKAKGVGRHATGNASVSEVMAALKKAGRSGMTLAALRYAVGNKKIKRAISRLQEHVVIPGNQGNKGQGLMIKLK